MKARVEKVDVLGWNKSTKQYDIGIIGFSTAEESKY